MLGMASHIGKETLGMLASGGCQLKAKLSTISKDHATRMPRKGKSPELIHLARQGEEAETAKLEQLIRAFGSSSVHAAQSQHHSVALRSELLENADRGENFPLFLAQHAWQPSKLTKQLLLGGILDDRGAELQLQESIRPDLIVLLEPQQRQHQVTPEGSVTEVPPDDRRIPLEIVDMKRARSDGEPKAEHQIELAWYAQTLACWLREEGMDQSYLVSSQAAVWGGDPRSGMDAPPPRNRAGAWTWWQGQLERCDMPRALQKLQLALNEALPELASKPWEQQPWQLTPRCASCEYLHGGESREEMETSCLERALTRDAAGKPALQSADLSIVPGSELLGTGIDSFPKHARRAASGRPSLLAAAMIAELPGNDTRKAEKLQIKQRALAIMERKPKPATREAPRLDLPSSATAEIFAWMEHDPSTGLIASISLDLEMMRPAGESRKERSKMQHFVAGSEHVSDEGKIVREALETMSDHLRRTLERGGGKGEEKGPTFQLYLWDQEQLDLWTQAVARHLEQLLEIPQVRGMCWITPGDELLPHHRWVGLWRPARVIWPEIARVLALPIAPFVSPGNVAAALRNALRREAWNIQPPTSGAGSKAAQLSMRDLGIHGSLLPRIAKLWKAHGQAEEDPRLEKLLTARVLAIKFSLWRIKAASRRRDGERQEERSQLDLRRGFLPEVELAGRAPQISPLFSERIAPAGAMRDLWYQHSLVSAATAKGESDREKMLDRDDREERGRVILLSQLGPAGPEWPAGAIQATIADGSSLTRIKAGSMNLSLRHPDGSHQAELLHLDRQAKRAIIRCAQLTPQQAQQLRSAWVEMGTSDHLSRKLLECLISMGGAASDGQSADVSADRLILEGTKKLRGVAPLQAGQLSLLQGEANHADREPTEALAWLGQAIEQGDLELDHSQMATVQNVLKRQVSLIWGPPGTGKSQALSALACASIAGAQTQGSTMRILVTAANYAAVDNLARRIIKDLQASGLKAQAWRVQSAMRLPEPIEGMEQVMLQRSSPSTAAIELAQLLEEPRGQVMLCAMPHQQLHNLATMATEEEGKKVQGKASRPWFDLMMVDEASQMEAGGLALIASRSAPAGQLVVAGDPLQLPPIQAPVPRTARPGLESAYGHLVWQGAKEERLLLNHRSMPRIVDASRKAGYPQELAAERADEEPLADDERDLAAMLLAPSQPCIALVHELYEGRASNRLEVEICRQLALEMRRRSAADDQAFWSREVGFVSPHRAHGAALVEALQKAFPGVEAELITGAVDTVERYQGQERETIIVTTGASLRNAIASEEDFILDLKRWNVAFSRARSKLIVLCSRALIEHVPRSPESRRGMQLLRNYLELSGPATEVPVEVPKARSAFASRDQANELEHHRAWVHTRAQINELR